MDRLEEARDRLARTLLPKGDGMAVLLRDDALWLISRVELLQEYYEAGEALRNWFVDHEDKDLNKRLDDMDDAAVAIEEAQ